jgi:hypothetical protein
LPGVWLPEHWDLRIVYPNDSFANLDLAGKPTVDGVVLEEMGEGSGLGKIVDPDPLEP